jgi:RecA-family ATPase
MRARRSGESMGVVMNAQGSFPTILDSALAYAARGWHVFPAPPGQKKSHKSAEHSDGRAWGATTDPDEIRRDWARWPEANVGIVTGPKSGFFVVECDTEAGHGIDGIGNMAALIEEHGPLPDTIEALSPSGSWHILFRYPEWLTIENSQGVVAPGIDVRGDGGMVLGVPSIKPGAPKPYRWKNPPPFFELGDCPEWLLTLCQKAKPKLSEQAMPGGLRIDTGDRFTGKTAESYSRLIADMAIDGKKHEAVRDIAASLAGQGCSERFVEGFIRHHCPVWDRNVENSIRSGFAKYRSGDTADSEQEQEPLFLPATRWAGKQVPPREWHVADLIPANQVTMLSGDGDAGKSLLALQLAVATASGNDWIGRQIDRPGAALVLSCEDDENELHRRCAAICEAEGLDLGCLDRLMPRSLAGRDTLLATLDRKENTLAVTGLYRRLEADMERHKPALVALDTLADLHSGDEINRAHARQFVTMMRRLALRFRCAVVILSHPSLTGMSSGSGLSGSTGWSNSVRSRLYLERITEGGLEPDPDLRRLSAKKANYTRRGIEIALRWHAGRFVAEDTGTGLDRMLAHAKAERVFLDLLRRFNGEGRRVRHTTGDGYAPAAFANSGRAEGVSKAALRVAMEALFAKGKIVVAQEGPPSRRVSFIREAEE